VVNVVVLVALMFVPTALAAGVLVAGRRWQRWRERGPRGPVPSGPAIERIAGDLRRLRRQRADLAAQPPQPGRGVRRRALDGAYLDVLASACRALDVDPPHGAAAGHAAADEITRVEDELRLRGLEVG
jgi:hypothetical protein